MRRRILAGALVATALAITLPCTDAAVEREAVRTAAVVVNGETVFRVAEVIGIPAERRAAGIVERVEAVAGDRSIPIDSIRVEEKEGTTDLVAGERFLMSVTDADAGVEGEARSALAEGYAKRLRAAVAAYRLEREGGRLAGDALRALLATAVFVVTFLAIRWAARRVEAGLDGRFRARIRTLTFRSFPIVHAEQLWGVIGGALRALKWAAYLVAGYAWLHFTLSEFPWTRPAARQLLDYVLTPLSTIGLAAVGYLPNLAFLVVLTLIVRYLLRIGKLFFRSVEGGAVTFRGFDADWAMPTYKLVRVAVIAFAAVVAFPYLPGSNSQALKGVSLFFGVMFSLGSSSAISNVIAGYSLTYRRAFKVGDRVRIGEHTGDVVDTRILGTHLRTVKNEEVVIPNSAILQTAVVNYSKIARTDGLILHTTVGIGYDTPWRQVEAMLLLAASRTEGIMKEPRPFVLQQALADYAVNYELNVYTRNAQGMLEAYAALHRNIQDVFNEYGVQIMTPSYIADPAKDKVVPKENWYLPPASPPEKSGP